jgi:hypothetical protein
LFLFIDYMNVLVLVSLRRNDSSARILPWMEPLPREFIDRDYDGHWPTQALRVISYSLSAKGAVLLLAGSRKDGLVLAWQS